MWKSIIYVVAILFVVFVALSFTFSYINYYKSISTQIDLPTLPQTPDPYIPKDICEIIPPVNIQFSNRLCKVNAYYLTVDTIGNIVLTITPDPSWSFNGKEFRYGDRIMKCYINTAYPSQNIINFATDIEEFYNAIETEWKYDGTCFYLLRSPDLSTDMLLAFNTYNFKFPLVACAVPSIIFGRQQISSVIFE